MSVTPQRLSAILVEQIRCAEAMLETLARERDALAASDHDALAAATDAKSKLVDALEQLENARRDAPRDAKPDTREWQRLRDLIARCKEQNQRNGTLLKARAENVRIALKALRGTEPELYCMALLAVRRRSAARNQSKGIDDAGREQTGG